MTPKAFRSCLLAVLAWSAVVLAPALPQAAAAAEAGAAKPLGELYEVALLMDAAVLDLNMLLGEERSPIYKERLDGTLKKLEAAQKASAASLVAAGISAQDANAIATQVAGFVKLAKVNGETAMKTGATEGAVLDDMMLHRKDARTTLDRLYTGLEKRAGYTGSPISEARELALMLQQMSATYVENASAAYVSNRSQDSSDATIDQLARNFATRLDKLTGNARGEEATRLVRTIKSKWKFIERSMMNYQENTVPFLVDRYTQAIVVDLMSLAQALQKGA